MRPVHVAGMGLWSPGYADLAAWRAGTPDASVIKPKCRLVDVRLKRGSSRFANMLGEVVEQAARAAELDVRSAATFYGSSLGEIETMVELLRMLYEEEGKLSPNRFKCSVHNAASGLVSIGQGNTAFSTAIAGGARSFEATLLEAWAWLDAGEGDALLLAVADDRAPPPLDALDDHDALAVGVALTTRGAGPRLERLRVVEHAERHAAMSDALRANCASPGLELAAAIFDRREGPVALSPFGGPQWVADLVLS
ncbi:MAG: beta-ketoacyl synthase chain length factor [Sandaracinaceae bacterium]|nr:beta-ketoacyl synthase chain length factor [Sandaracinaceae bacterium]